MKNKEIEELLNELKEYAGGGMSGLYPSEDTVKNFVSYIEQLEKELKQEKKDYKETNDKCFELINENQQLKRNRDKAIERIQYEEMFDYDNNHLINFKEELKYILLKGDSDE